MGDHEIPVTLEEIANIVEDDSTLEITTGTPEPSDECGRHLTIEE